MKLARPNVRHEMSKAHDASFDAALARFARRNKWLRIVKQSV